MQNLQPNTGFTIFVIFFGVALLDALRNQNVLLVLFWISMGILFILLGRKKSSD
jgi:hypothetical protein